jgi:hypothetical protein
MHPFSIEASFTILLDVNMSVLTSAVLVDALLEVMGVDITLGLLPVALCMRAGQHCRRLVRRLWGRQRDPRMYRWAQVGSGCVDKVQQIMASSCLCFCPRAWAWGLWRRA